MAHGEEQPPACQLVPRTGCRHTAPVAPSAQGWVSNVPPLPDGANERISLGCQASSAKFVSRNRGRRHPVKVEAFNSNPILPTPPRLLLLDFDGLLVHYSHAVRIATLAHHCEVEPEAVAQAIFGSGLEAAYDSGRIDTATYLREIGRALGRPLDEAGWITARVASCRPQPQVVELVRQLDPGLTIGILSNNGGLMPQVMQQVVPALFPRLEGKLLCSAMLGVRKPAPEIFAAALVHFGVEARYALFVDDLFVNVRGARAAGLHAETARDARTLRKVLKRYRLL